MKWSDFDGLSKQELIAILALRQRVFMLEQQSLYLDIDGLDQSAEHLMFYSGKALAGCARLRLIPGKAAPLAKLERVVLDKAYRGKGMGKALVQALLDRAKERGPLSGYKLSAQVDMKALYEGFGFVATGEIYDDGGIPHQDMTKPWR